MKSKYQSHSGGRVGSSASESPYRDHDVTKIISIRVGLDTGIPDLLGKSHLRPGHTCLICPKGTNHGRCQGVYVPGRFDFAVAPVSAAGLLDQRAVL